MSDDLALAEDGLLANVVGSWAEDKHNLVARYVGISSAARKRYLGPGKAGATYIEPYCATGMAQVRNSGQFINGSTIRAWEESNKKNAAFSQILIGDKDQNVLSINAERLRQRGANPECFHGAAIDTITEMTRRINPYGLHLCFLDPYSLEALPFTVIEKLAQFKRMDMIIHVSSQDLQRNFQRCLTGNIKGLDAFAPNWRNSVDDGAPLHIQRRQVFEHWLQLIRTTGKSPARGIEHITGQKNQTLYWLVLVSSHPKAEEFWDKIRNVDGQAEMPF